MKDHTSATRAAAALKCRLRTLTPRANQDTSAGAAGVDGVPTCPVNRRQASHYERGQVLPLLAFGMFGILAMAALVFDVGFWRYQERLEQAAADSAAVAGAIQLYYPITAVSGSATAPVEVTVAAQKAATANGFADDGGLGDTVVTVHSPPTVNAPPYAGATPYPSNTAVEVVVKHKQPVFFAGILGQTRQFVSARAVAAMKRDDDTCVYQLDPTQQLQMVPSGNMSVIGCGVSVNGGIPSGTISAPVLSYSGPPPGANLIPPLIARKGLPVTDPCLTIAGCAYLQRSTFPTYAIDARSQPSLSPGTYINCCAPAVALAPGVYYFYGGITGGTLVGDGVTIVNVDGAVTFAGHGGMNITAPASGSTAGIAFYQPPSNHNDYTGNGNPGSFVGLFYAPSATYRTNGYGDTFSPVMVVGGLRFTGGKTMTVSGAGASGSAAQQAAQPTHVALSE